MTNLTGRDREILDAVISSVDAVAQVPFVPKWNKAVPIADNDLLEKLAELKAYSATRSDLVSAMIKSGALNRAFSGFDVRKVAALDSDKVIAGHWGEIKVIRFKNKVASVIRAAGTISKIAEEYGGFWKYFERQGFPVKIAGSEDIVAFWDKFDAFAADLKRRGMPIINSEVTLLHFLETYAGLPCLKPDVVVMRVAENTGLLPQGVRGSHRLVVKKMQEYCIDKNIPPVFLDRYLLAFGGQAWAERFVKRSYCTKNGGCASPDCPLGKKSLCPSFGKA